MAKLIALPGPKDVRREPRTDGWQNLVTLLGTSADKRTGAKIHYELRDPGFYEELYAGGGIPARIVDLVPEEALREWVAWQNVENEEREMIEDRCEELDVMGALAKTWKWGRAYGGGCLHIVTDTRDPSSPLRRGERVLALRDFSRWDLRILTTDVEYDLGSRNYGHPRIYYLNVQMGSQYKGYPIHWTRMIRFDGQLVPRRTYIKNGYWHDSILNRLYDTVRDYQMSNDAAAACLQDFNVDVFKMKNLANLIQAGKEDVVRARMEIIQYAKSVLNMMLIDGDDEEYENKGRALEGVAELLAHQANRLVAETDIPHTKLLGESPDGSNATGNSTSQQWYNFVSAEQKNYLRPKMKRLMAILFPEFPRLTFKFNALRKLDALEEADLRNKQSTTDKNYIDSGVVDPSEIAQSRFGGEEYSIETELDEEARAAGLIGAGSGQVPAGIDEQGNPVDAMGNPIQAQPPGAQGQPGVGGVPAGQEEQQNAQPPQIKPGDGKPGKKSEPQGATSVEAEESAPPADGGEAGVNGGEYAPKHSKTPPAKNPKPAVQNVVGPTESLPMLNPNDEPKMKGPGTPNNPRTFLPTRGSGVMAPSGFDPEKDAGKKGTQQDVTGSEDEETQRKDAGESALMPRQLDDQAGKDAQEKRASVIIVKRGDQFLMGRRRDTGRWTLPGGMVEDRESHHQGAVRELAEETGISAKRLKFLGARMVEPEQGKTVHVNLYQHHADQDVKPHGKFDPDKEIGEFRWVDLKAPLPDEIAGNLQHPNNVALDHLGLL